MNHWIGLNRAKINLTLLSLLARLDSCTPDQEFQLWIWWSQRRGAAVLKVPTWISSCVLGWTHAAGLVYLRVHNRVYCNGSKIYCQNYIPFFLHSIFKINSALFSRSFKILPVLFFFLIYCTVYCTSLLKEPNERWYKKVFYLFLIWFNSTAAPSTPI